MTGSLRAPVSGGGTFRRALVGANPRRTILRAGLLCAASVVVFGFVLMPVRGLGPSMSPTLRDGQFVLVNRLAYVSGQPRRGDIVALGGSGRRVVYIKRIVGLPGERVRLERGIVLVNDAPLDEPYVDARQPWHVRELRLGDDEYLVIGDNRGMPQRNHDFGKTRRHLVLGRVLRW